MGTAAELQNGSSFAEKVFLEDRAQAGLIDLLDTM